MVRRTGTNLDQVIAVAAALRPLLDRFVLVGGCATSLLITDPAAPEVRPTLDVDLIVDVATRADFARIETALRDLGFSQRLDEEVICRWRYGRYAVDVMPTDPRILGFSNRWYGPAIEAATSTIVAPELSVRHVTAPYFLATKIEAFTGRGEGDFGASADIDDIVAVVDGRVELTRELAAVDTELKSFIAETLASYLTDIDTTKETEAFLVKYRALAKKCKREQRMVLNHVCVRARAAKDRSPAVRRVAGSFLIDNLDEIDEAGTSIAKGLATDRYPSVAERGQFVLDRLG